MSLLVEPEKPAQIVTRHTRSYKLQFSNFKVPIPSQSLVRVPLLRLSLSPKDVSYPA